MRAAVAAVVALSLTGCVPTPETYPLPPQHKPVTVDPTAGLSSFINASDANADLHIIKDVRGLESAAFRWTFAEPEFRFVVSSADNKKLRLDFGVNDVTFRDTGPLRLTYLINGHELATETYDSFGDRTFIKPVPAAWLRTREENRVVIRVGNPWQAPNGEKLGFLVHAIGFVD